MTEGVPRGIQAGEWLHEHFAETESPHIDISWQSAADPAAYDRLLEILFLPETGSQAA